MKRILCLLMVLVTMVTSTITVEAAESTKNYDRKFKAYYNRIETRLNKAYEEASDEDKSIVTDVDIDYVKMGYGLYEIMLYFEVYNDDLICVNVIFDIEEEDGYVYATLNNERITEDELDELYPELDDLEMEVDLDY